MDERKRVDEPQMERITVTLDPEMAAKLKEIAERRGDPWSVSSVTRDLLAKALKNTKPTG